MQMRFCARKKNDGGVPRWILSGMSGVDFSTAGAERRSNGESPKEQWESLSWVLYINEYWVSDCLFCQPVDSRAV
jgi:hypothetical protein